MYQNDKAPAIHINSGNYAGDNAVNRAVPHGLVNLPVLVLIIDDANFVYVILRSAPTKVYYNSLAISGLTDVTSMSATAFYVTLNQGGANSSGLNYSWIAIG
jgi:hypothetical protein